MTLGCGVRGALFASTATPSARMVKPGTVVVPPTGSWIVCGGMTMAVRSVPSALKVFGPTVTEPSAFRTPPAGSGAGVTTVPSALTMRPSDRSTDPL